MSFGTVVPNNAGPVKKNRKIGLWGASGSGKTSFLAALFVAVNQAPGQWNIIGDNPASVRFATRMTESLTQRHVFPPKTEGIEKLSWTIVGEGEQTVGKRFKKQRETVPLRFQLELVDAPGRLYAGSDGPASDDDFGIDFGETKTVQSPSSLADQLAEELAVCDSLVYLFDPLREHDNGDEFQHFQWALQNIAFICNQQGRFDTRLPHHLAVCITKLDDPRIFKTAYELGYLTADKDDPYLFPRIIAGQTENLFMKLGERSPNRSAIKVHDSIQRYFHRDRVNYFATSSVGFYLPPGASQFRRANFRNVVLDDDKNSVIRGEIHPINVLEPLLWVGDMVSR